MTVSAAEQARFKAKISHGEGCWEWQGARNTLGYGTCWINGRHELTHRVALVISGVPIAPDELALHRCDNPPCVRPDHLFVGTHRDNARDAEEKGRRPRFSGERNGRARLTYEQVDEIRRVYAAGGISLVDLASRYDVCKSQIHNIVRGRGWNEMPGSLVPQEAAP